MLLQGENISMIAPRLHLHCRPALLLPPARSPITFSIISVLPNDVNRAPARFEKIAFPPLRFMVPPGAACQQSGPSSSILSAGADRFLGAHIRNGKSIPPKRSHSCAKVGTHVVRFPAFAAEMDCTLEGICLFRISGTQKAVCTGGENGRRGTGLLTGYPVAP